MSNGSPELVKAIASRIAVPSASRDQSSLENRTWLKSLPGVGDEAPAHQPSRLGPAARCKPGLDPFEPRGPAHPLQRGGVRHPPIARIGPQLVARQKLAERHFGAGQG